MLLCMLICVCAEKAKAATAKKYTERARSNEEEERFKARIYKKATYILQVL